MTEARRIPAAADGGPLRGGAPRAVWLAVAAAPRTVSLAAAAQRLISDRRPSHLLWDPETGEIAQLVSARRAACALIVPGCPGTNVNTEGRACLQIAVLAHPGEPFTDGPLAGLDPIMDWLDSWSVPRRWPAGQPAGDSQAGSGQRADGQARDVQRADGQRERRRALWARGGHFGAGQVPDCENTGPGSISIARLTGTALHGVSLSSLPISA
jgi:hypothetical protein